MTENFLRVISLVTSVKANDGLHYNPKRMGSGNTDPYISSKEALINGLLSEEKTGTCSSIQIVIVAVGRRLGYPMYVAQTPEHSWARWDGEGERFNIEASNPGGGFTDFEDQHYRNMYLKSEAAIRAGATFATCRHEKIQPCSLPVVAGFSKISADTKRHFHFG